MQTFKTQTNKTKQSPVASSIRWPSTPEHEAHPGVIDIGSVTLLEKTTS